MKKAISVLSGGLDCTVATCVFSKEYDIHAITFNYGQKAFERELQAAREICNKMNWTHEVIDLPWLSNISNSSLNTSEEIPELSEDDLDNFEKAAKVQAAFGFLQEIWFSHRLQFPMLKALELKK
jgi:Predicted PP-loop superfamily ATPase